MTIGDVAVLAGAGGVAGFLAGLLGVGGGIVLVPVFYYLLGNGVDADMHRAVATSLAVIIPTGLMSSSSHMKAGSFDGFMARRLGPGMALGALAGALAAHKANALVLKCIFAAVLVVMSFSLMRPPRETATPKIPPLFDAPAGAMIGAVSALAGIGGATLGVPYMSTFRGIPIHRAVGTAAFLGLCVALPGALTYLGGGFVNLYAFLIAAPAAMAAVPAASRLSRRVPVVVLRTLFSVFMLLVAVAMIAGHR